MLNSRHRPKESTHSHTAKEKTQKHIFLPPATSFLSPCSLSPALLQLFLPNAAHQRSRAQISPLAERAQRVFTEKQRERQRLTVEDRQKWFMSLGSVLEHMSTTPRLLFAFCNTRVCALTHTHTQITPDVSVSRQIRTPDLLSIVSIHANTYTHAQTVLAG